MNAKKDSLKHYYFTKGEKVLFCVSCAFIVVSFLLFDRSNYTALVASLTGAAALIYNAKGNPLGPLLTIAFSVIYGFIAYSFCYYGEMITYLGMTAPMALAALISWLKNPFKGDRSQVAVGEMTKRDAAVMALAAGTTVVFYFALRALHTPNLLLSALSVTTSFIAVFLTLKRSEYYAIAYAVNDAILVALWIYAAGADASYFSVAVCFTVFLANDIYGFINWSRMRKKQSSELNNGS